MKINKIIWKSLWFLLGFVSGFWWIVMSVSLLPEIIDKLNPSWLVSLLLTLGIAGGAIALAWTCIKIGEENGTK